MRNLHVAMYALCAYFVESDAFSGVFLQRFSCLLRFCLPRMRGVLCLGRRLCGKPATRLACSVGHVGSASFGVCCERCETGLGRFCTLFQ